MEPNLSIVLISVALFLCTIFYLLRQKTNIPGPPTWPLIGNLTLLEKIQKVESKADFLSTLAEKYGQVFRLYFGPFPVVYVCGFKNVNHVLQSQAFTDRPSWIPVIRMAQKMRKGNGVTWSNGETWKAIRRFSLKTMREFGVGRKSMEEKILDEVQNLTEEFQKSMGKSIGNIRDLMTFAAGNVIHHTIFGYRYRYDHPNLQKLVTSLRDMFTGFSLFTIDGIFPILRLFKASTWKVQLKGRKYLADYISDQIQRHRESFDEKNIRDFVDLYIKSENDQTDGVSKFENGELFSIIMELFVAGSETTSFTLEAAFLYMIAYPKVQQKCQEEITKFVGEGRMIKTSDRPQLKYIEATLMEIQRLTTIAAVPLPRMAKENTTIDGYSVEKGTTVVVVLASAHKDKTIWEDPLAFRPERFLDDDGNIINKKYFLPFSAGARNCPGESLARTELFLVFTNMLQRFTFQKVDAADELSFKEITEVVTHVPDYRLKVAPH